MMKIQYCNSPRFKNDAKRKKKKKRFPVSSCNTDVDTIRVPENPPLKEKAGHSGCVRRRHSERRTANHSERRTANHSAGCCQRGKSPISVEGLERKEAPLKLRPQQPHGETNATRQAPPHPAGSAHNPPPAASDHTQRKILDKFTTTRQKKGREKKNPARVQGSSQAPWRRRRQPIGR